MKMVILIVLHFKLKAVTTIFKKDDEGNKFETKSKNASWTGPFHLDNRSTK